MRIQCTCTCICPFWQRIRLHRQNNELMYMYIWDKSSDNLLNIKWISSSLHSTLFHCIAYLPRKSTADFSCHSWPCFSLQVLLEFRFRVFQLLDRLLCFSDPLFQSVDVSLESSVCFTHLVMCSSKYLRCRLKSYSKRVCLAASSFPLLVLFL